MRVRYRGRNRSAIRGGFRKEKAFQAASAIGPCRLEDVGGGRHTRIRTYMNTRVHALHMKGGMKQARRGVRWREIQAPVRV